uniref:beta-glucosidase n=1 Tax=Thraustotheca clavata TaxID=74557 RepID=A0A0A7CMI8_9STRA|nr:secreted protein [Thraustotheca clavata]
MRLRAAIALPILASLCAANTWDDQAEAKINAMTTDEWIGQMAQLDMAYINNQDLTLNEDRVRQCARLRVGSFLDATMGAITADARRAIVTRINQIFAEEGAPPVLFGLDSIHGASYVTNAALSPQQINKGASFNRDLINKSSYVTARDSAASGVNWIFAPNADIVVHKRWSRIFEAYGEDPYLASEMINQAVTGVQAIPGVAANFKHFIAYGDTSTGDDRGNAYPSEYDLLNYYSPSFISAVNAGALSGMSSYVVVNDVPMVSNQKLTVDLLRNDMKFDGLLVTDWQDIYNLLYHNVGVSTRKDAIKMSLSQSSIDMSMVPDDPDFITLSKELLSAGALPASRFRAAAKRVVKMKLQLGLYDTPVVGKDYVSLVGSDADRTDALNLARESIVLLKNKDNVLPLSGHPSIFLTGPSIDNIGYLCGGWTLEWQGVSGNSRFPKGKSILKGFQDIYGSDAASKIQTLQGVDISGVTTDKLDTAKSMASQSQYTVIAVGEPPSTEMAGNIADAKLPAGQLQYIRDIASTGTKVILVLVEARPRILNGVADVVHAVIDAMLPCEAGGQAIAEIILGQVNPSGRLSMTYPKDTTNDNMVTPYFHRKNGVCVTTGSNCPAEWEFGTGLSYTTFSYGNLTLSSPQIATTDSLTVTTTITNTGSMAGKESVLLFITQKSRQNNAVAPEVKLLKKFTKISLAAGASQQVSFTISAADLSIYTGPIGSGLKTYAEQGIYYIALKPETLCDADHVGPMCQAFTFGTPNTDSVISLYNKAGKIVTSDQWNIWVQNPSGSPSLNQQFVYDTKTKQIRDKNLGRCFDVYQDSSAPIGYRIHMYSCDANNGNQKWNLNANGHQIIHATFTNVCLDADPNDKTGAMQVWWCATIGTNSNQFFSVHDPKAEKASLTSPMINKALTISAQSARSGVTFASNPSTNWVFDWVNNMVRVDSGNNQCLDAYQPQDGGAVHVWDCDASNGNQKWQWDPLTGQLRHLTHKGYCLDIQSASGATPYMWTCHPTNDYWYKYQQFNYQTL